MPRFGMIKQNTPYLALFLIAFSLYAVERNKAHPTFIQKEMAEPLPAGEVELAPELVEIYHRLRVAPVFTQAVDGVKLIKGDHDIRIEIINDELYHEQETAVEDTWLPVLDQIGNVLFKEGELKVVVVFSSNATEEKDSFAFSAARAEWVLHYFSRKHQFKLDAGQYRVMGMGKTVDTQGKSTPKLEIIIHPES
jgi:flagellar motor protein MotB